MKKNEKSWLNFPAPLRGFFYFPRNKNDYKGMGKPERRQRNAPRRAAAFFAHIAICKNDYVYSGAAARNLRLSYRRAAP